MASQIAYPCFDDKDVDFQSTPNPHSGRPRGMTQSPSRKGLIKPSLILPPKKYPGWCRLSPQYRDLPASASSAMKRKALEFWAQASFAHEAKVYDIDGQKIAFIVEQIYNDNDADDYWYYGVGAYQQVNKGAPFVWDPIPLYLPGDRSVAPGGLTAEQKVAWGKQAGRFRSTTLGPWAAAVKTGNVEIVPLWKSKGGDWEAVMAGSTSSFAGARVAILAALALVAGAALVYRKKTRKS